MSITHSFLYYLTKINPATDAGWHILHDEGSSKSGSSAEDAKAGSGGAGENGAKDAAESGKDEVVPAVVIRDILCKKE